MANLSRRGFLKMVGMAAPAAVVAPKYFLPPIGGWGSGMVIHPNPLAVPGRIDLLELNHWRPEPLASYPGRFLTPEISGMQAMLNAQIELLEKYFEEIACAEGYRSRLQRSDLLGLRT